MSTLKNEVSEILGNQSAPDAPLPPAPQTEPKRGRGRPPKSGVAPVVRKDTTKTGQTEAEAHQGAVAINTAVFSIACVITGTGKAFPEKEKADIMDKALARYMSLKGIQVPAEVALVAVYGGWLKEISTNDEVKKSVQNRFGGWRGKIASIFTRKKKEIKP